MLGRRSFLGAIAGTATIAGTAATKIATHGATEFFPDFRRLSVRTAGAEINVLVGGQGPPLLLLHGYPQTHIEWRKVAPELAKTRTVVVPDLRGYGDSSKPIGGAHHAGYAKRAMAADQIEVMSALGFQQFAMVAHDRGARVGHRLLLDHPERVSRAILMDICPTSYMYEHADRAFGAAYFHWFFLIQDAPFPERLIGNNADAWLRYAFDPAIPAHIEPAAYAEYLRCFSQAATIHASCEDYRAAASIDLEHDKADHGRKITCPLHVLWGSKGFVGRTYDVLSVWHKFADDVSGNAIESGHWIAEEAPHELLSEVQRFLV
jgi:haloacetate dehalogenase